MKTLPLFLAVLGQLSLSHSDEIGPHRKEHRIGKDTVILEKVSPDIAPQNLKRTQSGQREFRHEAQAEFPQEYYGIWAITYPNGLSKVECWPLGLGRDSSSTVVSNLNWGDLEGLSKLDLGGISYSFILFRTPASNEEFKSRPSGLQPLSNGEAQYRGRGGRPDTLRFIQRLHSYVTENGARVKEDAIERRNQAQAKAEELKKDKEKPKTTVIRYWKRQSK